MIKIFTGTSLKFLEKDINEFLVDKTLIDIKFTIYNEKCIITVLYENKDKDDKIKCLVE